MNRALSACLLAALLAAGSAGSAYAQWITFSGSPDGSRIGEGGEGGGYGSTPVRGFLTLPVEPGRHPAVVLLPSCEGRKLFHQSWARALSERGFAALVVDDYFMHDRDQSCGLADPAAKADVLRARLLHAMGAARFLSTRPDVEAERMAVMGWGDAPVDVLLGEAAGSAGRPRTFRAGIVVSPARCYRSDPPPPRPLLVLHSETGAAKLADECSPPADGPLLEVRVYEGTAPGFDDPQAEPERNRGMASSASSAAGYDRLAHIRAIEDVAAFLDRRLPLRPLDNGHDYSGTSIPEIPVAGIWAVDPNMPGPDLPTLGGSAFDAVFSREGPSGPVYDVPFPFSRLLQKLEHAAGGNAAARSPLDATLIPLGRSLQREAAAPDYFESPRIVVAVTGEPASGNGPLGVRLKDRLFIGYQPRANVVEVISYNEAANRFEFQVVRGYGSDREPQVGYAPRALCMSCHHNAGPIFSDASWDETSANARVVRRLASLGARFHGVAVEENDRAVTAIDAATDEANLLGVYQRLWSEGCSSAQRTEVARCRAGAFQAMIQYRLSNSAGFDRASPLFTDGYLPLQRRAWAKRWPDGLLIPNPNLPNRSPLMSPSPASVLAAQDPLRPRPPLARWNYTSVRDLERLVRGLSHSLPDESMVRLDRYLRESAGQNPVRSLTTECRIIRRGFAERSRRFQVDCGTQPPSAAGFYLQAELRLTPDGEVSGETSWLEIGGGAYARRATIGRFESGAAIRRIVVRLVGEDGETPVRAPDGNSLLALTLAWDPQVADTVTRFDATGNVTIAADFRPVASALTRLASATPASSPLLAERFDGVMLSGWLLAELGAQPMPRCCKPRPVPAPRLDAAGSSTAATLSSALEERGPLLTFRRYCGACHGNDTTYPPGFLNGDSETILDTVAHCAERIHYRLSMWRRRSEDQAVPPMPPTQGLSLARTNADEWRKSESLERLIAYSRDLLVAQGQDPGELLDGSYHATRACLPSGRGEGPAVTRK